MTLSDIYRYLHIKQGVLTSAIKFSSGDQKRKMRQALKKFIECEEYLDSLCEAVYYFNLGQQLDDSNHETKC